MLLSQPKPLGWEILAVKWMELYKSQQPASPKGTIQVPNNSFCLSTVMVIFILARSPMVHFGVLVCASLDSMTPPTVQRFGVVLLYFQQLLVGAIYSHNHIKVNSAQASPPFPLQRVSARVLPLLLDVQILLCAVGTSWAGTESRRHRRADRFLRESPGDEAAGI